MSRAHAELGGPPGGPLDLDTDRLGFGFDGTGKKSCNKLDCWEEFTCMMPLDLPREI